MKKLVGLLGALALACGLSAVAASGPANAATPAVGCSKAHAAKVQVTGNKPGFEDDFHIRIKADPAGCWVRLKAQIHFLAPPLVSCWYTDGTPLHVKGQHENTNANDWGAQACSWGIPYPSAWTWTAGGYVVDVNGKEVWHRLWSQPLTNHAATARVPFPTPNDNHMCVYKTMLHQCIVNHGNGHLLSLKPLGTHQAACLAWNDYMPIMGKVTVNPPKPWTRTHINLDREFRTDQYSTLDVLSCNTLTEFGQVEFAHGAFYLGTSNNTGVTFVHNGSYGYVTVSGSAAFGHALWMCGDTALTHGVRYMDVRRKQYKECDWITHG
jgi:hypothetical protein